MSKNEKKLIPTDREKKFIDLLNEGTEALEGDVCNFDDSERESIKTVVKDKLDNAIRAVNVFSPHLGNIFSNLKGEEVICVTQKTIEKAKKIGADFGLNSAKDALSPLLKKGGKIMGHADLEKRVLPNANLGPALASAALARQIVMLQYQLESIQESLNFVLQGQWNDRFAKIDAAKNQLFLAVHTKDTELKKNILTNALNLTCQGEFEILRSMKDEIDSIKSIGIGLIGFRVKQKTIERMENLMNHIPYLFDSWNVKMILLQECEEYDAIREESCRISSEMKKIFSKENIEELRSRTHKKIGVKKIGKKFWTNELPEKLNKNANLLGKICEQSNFLLELQNNTNELAGV